MKNVLICIVMFLSGCCAKEPTMVFWPPTQQEQKIEMLKLETLEDEKIERDFNILLRSKKIEKCRSPETIANQREKYGYAIGDPYTLENGEEWFVSSYTPEGDLILRKIQKEIPRVYYRKE